MNTLGYNPVCEDEETCVDPHSDVGGSDDISHPELLFATVVFNGL